MPRRQAPEVGGLGGFAQSEMLKGMETENVTNKENTGKNSQDDDDADEA